ncbi:MAG: hypothetical protein ACK5LC_02880, partial [Coprobacillaceae bacterium]
MSRKYYSKEAQWSTEKGQVQPLDSALTILKDIDTLYLDAKDICNQDDYKTPIGLSYSSVSSTIEKIRGRQENCMDYLGWIHSQVSDIESEFAKEISGITEKLSKIDINEFEVDNTVGSTKTETRMSAYERDKYETVTIEKSKITYEDILRDGDVLDLQGRYDDYKKATELAGDDVISKEDYITYMSTINFDHEVYADGWLKDISNFLDMLPIVGNAKNLVEAIAGQSMTGELYTDAEKLKIGIMAGIGLGFDLFSYGMLPIGPAFNGVKFAVAYGLDVAMTVGVQAVGNIMLEMGLPP